MNNAVIRFVHKNVSDFLDHYDNIVAVFAEFAAEFENPEEALETLDEKQIAQLISRAIRRETQHGKVKGASLSRNGQSEKPV